jgi:predicted hydrocarbon binding protein
MPKQIKERMKAMRQSQAVSSLFKERILLPPESVSNSLLGYLFFREKLVELVLGDSEVQILYWVGKELGNSTVVQQVEEIEDIFGQLDLGQVFLEGQSPSSISFRIHHNRFNLLPEERLMKTLHLEAGFIAGLLEVVTGQYCVASLIIKKRDAITSALVEVGIDEKKAL